MKIEPRITRPGLRIDAKGRWEYENNILKNEKVLCYFKKQLRRDNAKNYYIDNVWGNLREHGYLDEVAGFPLRVQGVSPLVSQTKPHTMLLQIKLDSQEELIVKVETLRILSQNTIIVILMERGQVPARFSVAAMLAMSPYLHHDVIEGYSLVLPSSRIREKLKIGKASTFLQPAI